MSQLYNKAAVSQRDAIVDDLGDWIDQYSIASLVVEAIGEEWSGVVTLERAKELWYLACDGLAKFLEERARWLPEPDDEE